MAASPRHFPRITSIRRITSNTAYTQILLRPTPSVVSVSMILFSLQGHGNPIDFNVQDNVLAMTWVLFQLHLGSQYVVFSLVFSVARYGSMVSL